MPEPFRGLRMLLRRAALLLAAPAFGQAPPPAPIDIPHSPNVIVIMADDLGAECLGSYGSTLYTTPRLDRMAREGLRFENAYTSPLCTPTRVSIMSGLQPNRTGFRALISRAEGMRMPAAIPTFGHDFRRAGYATAVAGKWQLGKFHEFPAQPVEHGFDAYCLWTWIYETVGTINFSNVVFSC
ncbi:MAG: sulfatase-like hydrolase/transferase, partial [Planctomycetota bacterium]